MRQGGRVRTLAIGNAKGGTGKMTTAVSLAHGLAMRGQRILLVDADTQGQAGRCGPRLPARPAPF